VGVLAISTALIIVNKKGWKRRTEESKMPEIE
jgi:hypothetical protein